LFIVPSKHQEASSFIRRKFFEGLKSFQDFEARTEQLANTKEVGDAFEILVEAYLHLNPVLKVKDVWLVGAVPSRIRTRLKGIVASLGSIKKTDSNWVLGSVLNGQKKTGCPARKSNASTPSASSGSPKIS